ncbi:TPA: DUF177 domain-containing protein, partial [Candidatus Bipolaricaulota bacterium]|nr:DUF177 domain-containing protein [Candidatus Bipolaricaulota bacterium]
GSTREYEVSEDITGLDKEIGPAGLLKGKLRFLHAGRYNILVTGALMVPLRLTCSRCLEPTVQMIEIKLEEEFKATVDVNTGVHLHWGEDVEGCNLIDSSHILDLTEVVRQNILVSIPMKILCRPDCAGLCPHCGHNLNEGPCGCEVEEIDPRWAALKELLNV